MAEDNSDEFAESGHETMRDNEAATARAYRHIVGVLDQLNPDTRQIDAPTALADRLQRLCASPFDVLEIEDDDGTVTDTPVVRVADVIAALDGMPVHQRTPPPAANTVRAPSISV